jgi:pyruvate formate lyase activating enzyme
MCGGCESACINNVHKIDNGHTITRKSCKACSRCVQLCPTGALDICGKKMTADKIIEAVQKDSAFYGDVGGVTISGGEPFAHKYAAVELLKKCKENGLNTAVETCGYADPQVLRAALPYVDLFLWDIKDTDDIRHRQYTGVSNQLILENLQMINELDAKIRLRCILVNGINTNEKHYHSLAKIASQLKNFDGIEFLPYHAYAGAKATFIGKEDNGNKLWIPTSEQIQCAKNILLSYRVNVL